MAPALRELEDRARELGVRDLQIGMVPLEQVFLSVVAGAERRAAAAEGATAEVLLEGADPLRVPVGAPTATAAGYTYDLRWVQDENGHLALHSTTRRG